VCWLVLAVCLIGGVGEAGAWRAPELKTVRYHGYTARVPSWWPVYDLARDPGRCVRFDRHAVYLGTPGSQERCPAHAAGHTSALLLEPVGTAARAGAATVRVITTAAGTRDSGAHSGHSAPARPAGVSAHAAAVYTGPGFDACATPSTRTMSAWSSSPYHAIGVYIGGTNSACAQSNLNRSWIGIEVAAGWRLMPIYVGLQAPSNSCGCSGITASKAGPQGAAAADDAVAAAQSLGIPAGNPIYDDMESYSTGGTNTSAVLVFLSAWTTELHAKGYVSGVYSSASTGISDLSSRYGTGYREPDDLWIADWNGRKSTSDPYVPASDWSNHQRLHQNSGDHTETWGGATVDIDGDYLDGATAGTSGSQVAPPPKPPTLAVSVAPDGTASLDASWTAGHRLAAWRVLAGTSPGTLSAVGGAAAHGTHTLIRLASGAPYFAVQALGSSSRLLATSHSAAAPRHLAVFGHGAFVSQSGTGGIPAGCYAGRTCHIATTIFVGRTVIAATGTEAIPSGATGLLYFTLTTTGQFMLANSRGGRLPVRVGVRDISGIRATVPLTLIPFSTSGPSAASGVSQSPSVRILGATDFVPWDGLGGILASCSTPTPCHVAATLSVGNKAIATTGSESIGGEEAGYVFFSLSSRGRALLAHAPGNQLGARVSLTGVTDAARGTIGLVRFS
jgi:hypothetical protein